MIKSVVQVINEAFKSCFYGVNIYLNVSEHKHRIKWTIKIILTNSWLKLIRFLWEINVRVICIISNIIFFIIENSFSDMFDLSFNFPLEQWTTDEVEQDVVMIIVDNLSHYYGFLQFGNLLTFIRSLLLSFFFFLFSVLSVLLYSLNSYFLHFSPVLNSFFLLFSFPYLFFFLFFLLLSSFHLVRSFFIFVLSFLLFPKHYRYAVMLLSYV